MQRPYMNPWCVGLAIGKGSLDRRSMADASNNIFYK